MERRITGKKGAQDSMGKTAYQGMVDYTTLCFGQLLKMAEMKGTVTLIVLKGRTILNLQLSPTMLIDSTSIY